MIGDIKKLKKAIKITGIKIIEDNESFIIVDIPVEDKNYPGIDQEISLHGDNLPPFFIGKCTGMSGIFHVIENDQKEEFNAVFGQYIYGNKENDIRFGEPGYWRYQLRIESQDLPYPTKDGEIII